MYYSVLIAILGISSRGILQIFLGKTFAYISSIIVFYFFLFIFYKNLPKVKLSIKKEYILWGAGFLFVSIFSLLNSIVLEGEDNKYAIYIIYPIIISFSYVGFVYLFKNSSINRYKLYNSISTTIYILFVISVLEQLHLVEMPGESWTLGFLIRPASFTGSYLHYPLVMFLLGAICYSLRRKFSISIILAYSSVFLAFSRSGMMLVCSMLLFLFFKWSLLKRKKVGKLNCFILFIFICILSIACIWFSDFIYDVFNRFGSSINLNSAGNVGRVDAWIKGIDMYSNSNLIIGQYFGAVTNLTHNLIDQKSIVVESSFLQCLLNFGLIGCALFYSIFVIAYKSTENKIYQTCIMAVFFQTFIYQSIEVMPFILIFLLSSSIFINE